MRVSDVFAASMVAPLVAAHGGIEGVPRIFGMPKQLRASNPFAGFQARHAAHAAPALNGRQAAGPERCGPANGDQVCGGNDCCSASGYCGTTQAHCQAPDCLFNYGKGCDANKTPAGASTRNDLRTQLGSIPYGGKGIYVCNNPGTVAITFDDGPYIYTEGVMKLFEARGAHATFFITGNNLGKGAIDENWAGVIKKMYDNGHQVASHTWSHQDLSLITKEQAYDQMVKNEMAIRNIIGKYPTYMRPPYSSCDTDCQDVMADLGYVVSYFDLDTSDYLNLTPELIQNANDKFKEGIDTRNNAPFDGDRLVIGHDIHQLTAENLTAYMLDYLYAQGLKAVTMGECLQDPNENWYRDSTPAPPSTSSTRTSSAVPTATPTGPTSKDGSCGATGSDQSCVGFVSLDGLLGECCSQYGWCGNSADHCQTGCQAGFGKCGAQPSASPSASASASVSASATSPVPTPTGPTTTDGSCGANGMTCIGFVGPAGLSECCSSYGWCGNSVDHCSTGCQAGFGKCGAQDISSSSSVAISASSSLPVSTSQASSSSASAIKDTISSSVLSSVSASATDASSSVYVSSSASQAPSSSASATTDIVSSSVLSSVSASATDASSSVYVSSSASEKLESTSSIVPTASASEVQFSSVYSASASVSASASASAPASFSDYVSASVSASASASDYVSASISEHVSALASASASENVPPSVSASASASEYISASISASVSSSTYSVSASVSASVSENSDASASSTGIYSTSSDVSASKSYPTGSASSEYPASASEAISSSAVPQSSESSTVLPSFSLIQSSSSAYPTFSVIDSSARASSSMTATPVYSASSFSTAIIPSSTSCSTSSVKPTPTALPVSSNGKCGAANGGQTCAGYKSPWGIQMGCCCKQSGKCSVDPWACGLGCDTRYGKCWF